VALFIERQESGTPMDNARGVNGSMQVVFTAEQIRSRVREMAKEISRGFPEGTVCAVCVVENGFVFMADLIREIDRPVLCQFIRSDFSEQDGATEIFFSPEVLVAGENVLLIEGVIQSGVTTDFLVRNLLARGAKSVKLATLLDRHSERQIALQPDYIGFVCDGPLMVGYGLGAPRLGRNLPYLAKVEQEASVPAQAKAGLERGTCG
jgi:hypoxanthine phosphoribosyltransferase